QAEPIGLRWGCGWGNKFEVSQKLNNQAKRSKLHGRTGSLDDRIVLPATTFQIESACGEELVAPCGTHLEIIFEDRAAELVIVGVGAFQKDQPPRCVH